MRRPFTATFALALALVSACSSNDTIVPVDLSPGGGGGGAGGSGGGGNLPAALGTVPLESTLSAPGLSAPVELVRDDAGVPHVYAETLADAAFAQGYVTALDRFLQMDFFRRNASGTLSELLGESALPDDIEIRVNHLRANAEKVWAEIQASSEPLDRDSVAVLSAYRAGVNLWVDELKAGKHALPAELVTLGFSPQNVVAWSEVDSLAVSELQSFGLSYDISAELLRSALIEREKAVFAGSSDPLLAGRDGFVADLSTFRPFRPVFTLDGWGEVDGAARAPAALRPPLRAPAPDPELARLVGRVLPDVARLPAFGAAGPRGSNNWVVSGALSRSGHAMVANDTHLSLTNPSLFYLVHLTAGADFEVMGVQFPGAPLVTLGFNRRVAWGATVSQLDVTDVYRETVGPCAAGGDVPCVSFKGTQVPLVPRDEEFRVGVGGDVGGVTPRTVRLYDVPHHGPILPRITPGGAGVEPLGASELSVRYTGHDAYPLFRAILAINRAASAAELRRAVEAHFAYGRQNWVFADVDGDIGWTQGSRLPRRPADSKPWLVLPGDGSAEWQGFVDVTKMPRSLNPAKGYLVTANADPVGVTEDGDPMNEPVVDGLPLYLGADYETGARVARITERIERATADGGKLDPDAMADIQADAVSELGRTLKPHFVEAAAALAAYAASASPDPDSYLKPIVDAAPPAVRGLYANARDIVSNWSLDTPAGTEPGLDEAGRNDSRAALLAAVFGTRLNQFALGDELGKLEDKAAGFTVSLRSSERLLTLLLEEPESLATDPALLFDDLNTPDETETRESVLARAVSEAIGWAVAEPALGPDPAAWRWGAVHFVKPAFFVPVLFPELDQDAYPRHGGTGTVDVADPGLNDDRYSFTSGAAIRFVCELDPVKGPRARNVLPGGQVFDRASPHYKDQLELWARNEARALPFALDEVVASAQQEHAKNALGRLRFVPVAR